MVCIVRRYPLDPPKNSCMGIDSPIIVRLFRGRKLEGTASADR